MWCDNLVAFYWSSHWYLEPVFCHKTPKHINNKNLSKGLICWLFCCMTRALVIYLCKYQKKIFQYRRFLVFSYSTSNVTLNYSKGRKLAQLFMRLRAAVDNQLLNATNLSVVRRGTETLLRVFNNHMHVFYLSLIVVVYFPYKNKTKGL